MIASNELIGVNALKSLIRDAITYSEKSHSLLFKTENLVAAIGYLNSASAKMSAAQALYYSRYEELCRDEIECIFLQFDVFCRELLNNFSTGHSQQWANIEFKKLKDLFDSSACAFDA